MLGTMSSYPAPPADGLQTRWHHPGNTTAEEATLRWENEAWTLECVLANERTQAVMRVSPGWQVRQVLVFRDMSDPDLWLANDGGSRWGEVNGAHRDDLDGCTEVAVVGSVAAQVPSLRRLPLHVGHGADMRVAVIDSDTLSITPTVWRYTRLGDHRWQIDRGDGGEPWVFEVDRHGIPLDMGPERQRVNPDGS
jgi:hypothetical protein